MKTTGRCLAIVILLLTFGLRLHTSLRLGVQADEGVHITAAERAAAGDVLYRDLYENRTPAVEWLLALLVRLGAPTLLWGRWLSVAMAVLTGSALMTAGRLIMGQCYQAESGTGDLAGLLATWLFATTPLAIFWSRFIMLETFVAAAAILAITSALKAINSQRWYRWSIAGIWVGLAVLGKQSAIVLLPVFVVFLNLLNSTQNWRAGLRPLALWSAGLALPLVAFALILLGQGAFDDFLQLLAGADRLDPLINLSDKWSTFSAWATTQPLVPLALVGAVAICWQRRTILWLTGLWVGAEAGALLLPAELQLSWGGLSHYVLPAVTAGSLLAGCGVAWAWHLSKRIKSGRIILLALALSLTVLTLPGWWIDLHHVLWKSEYPQPDQSAEREIGEAVAGITTPAQRILVLGNASFYHWAGRSPAARFFHYPESLPTSRLAAEAEADLQQALTDPNTAAILVSRMHLNGRLSPTLKASLWQHWQPVALFPYSYQQGIFLFLQAAETIPPNQPLASFGDEIALTAVNVRPAPPNSLLVQLEWLVQASPAGDYTVFVHLLRADGSLLAQHDGIPVVGFRPTTGWSPEEIVTDWHWLNLPAAEATHGETLSVGLYQTGSAERLPVRIPGAQNETDAFNRPLQP